MNLIEVADVTKKYGDKQVVNGVSFDVRKGEVFGLLGPNGAGKTTTISMMSAQIDLTSGSIRINGKKVEPSNFEVKGLVGVVPQEISLYAVLNAYDNLHFFGSLYGLPRRELKERIDWILDLVGLKDRAKDQLRTYSGGMKRRINIAAALLHRPQVVFMDEPTVGIDPQSRNRIYELIQLLKEEGMTIVYTTHYMEEATVLCDRIAIVDNGRVIEYGTTQELIGKVHGGVVELTADSPGEADRILSLFRNKSFIVDCFGEANKVSAVVLNAQDGLPLIMDTLKSESLKVAGMNVMPPTLETLFLQRTGKTLRD